MEDFAEGPRSKFLWLVVQFLWELKQNQPVLTRSMAPALNSGEDEIEKKFQAMVKAGPCSSAGIVLYPHSIKDTHVWSTGQGLVFMMVRSGEWLPQKSLRLGVWTIFGGISLDAHPWQKFKSLWLPKRMQYIRVISSLQFQVFQFDLVCKHLGLSKKGEIAKNGNSNNGERKRRLSPLDFRVILTCSDDHHLSHTWLFYGLITHEIHHCLDRKGDSSYPGRRGYFKWLMNFHELLHIHISRSYSNICIYILMGVS